MAGDYDRDYREARARQPWRHAARLAQFGLRRMAPRHLADQLRLRAAAAAGGSIISTPGFLRPPPHRYQGYGGPWLEDYFFHHWLRHRPSTELSYLPVFWTDLSLHSQIHRYTPAQFHRFNRELRDLLDRRLAGPRRHFTLLEYEHMIWDWHLFPKNVAVFSAGGWGDIPIPMLKGSPPFSCPPKDIPLSFVGRLGGASDTGGVRSRMHAALKDRARFASGAGWRELMGRSTFSLCPRGLGRGTFRLYEALSVGSIPIYLWDDREWLPYREEIDWSSIALSIQIEEIGRLPELLAAYTPARISAMQAAIAALYDDYFTLAGLCRQVLRQVARLADPKAFRDLMARREYLPAP